MTTVLIVDDSSMMRRSIEQHLKDQKVCIIGEAENGKKAVAQVSEKRPDIVTLDITMPEMDGLACLEHIMQIAPETKVIIITALSDKLTGLQAIDKGAQGYLFKPVNPIELKETFEELLENKPA